MQSTQSPNMTEIYLASAFTRLGKEGDPFPDTSFLGIVDLDQHTEVEAGIGKLLQEAIHDVFWKTEKPTSKR